MSIEEVRALVAERQRYDDWLAALEAKRADTPPRVFERVHGDYLARRSEVLGQLQSHVGGLLTLRADMEQRLDDLEARLQAQEEDLAEGMLRNLVGEYDNERWDGVRREVEARIATLGGERAALLAEVEDVRALLASAHVEPAQELAAEPVVASPDADAPITAAFPTPAGVPVTEATPQASPAIEPASSVEVTFDGVATDVAPEAISDGEATGGIMIETIDMVAPPAAYVVGQATPTVAVDAIDDQAGDDDAGDEDSLLDIDVQAMVDTPLPTGPSHEDVLADVAALFDTASIAAVPAPTPQETAPPPADQAELDDALAMFGESTGPADRQFVESLQGIEAEHDARPDTGIVTPPPAPPAAAPLDDPFDDLAFLRSVIDQPGAGDAAVAPSAGSATSSEPQKTLRCTECGTMNLPTEWYCERCGGELAAF